MHDLELRRAERLPQVDALDLGADEAVDGADADFRLGLCSTAADCLARLVWLAIALPPLLALMCVYDAQTREYALGGEPWQAAWKTNS